MKTSCYHHFHLYCFKNYINIALKDQTEEVVDEEVPCPKCRQKIQINSDEIQQEVNEPYDDDVSWFICLIYSYFDELIYRLLSLIVKSFMKRIKSWREFMKSRREEEELSLKWKMSLFSIYHFAVKILNFPIVSLYLSSCHRVFTSPIFTCQVFFNFQNAQLSYWSEICKLVA